ncbi:hypothetical protein K439DRAFT_1641444 [Ramaria rubella]|nr:hypothetical protein K439DRAFT_1641444 [Ramaria rubella]
MALLCVHRSKGHHALLCGANVPKNDNGGDGGDDGSKRARVSTWEEQLAVIGVPDAERGSKDAIVNGRGGGGKELLRRLARINAGSSKTNVTERTTATHCADSRPVLKTKLYERASDSILRRVSSSEAVQPRCHKSGRTGKLTIKRWLGGGTFREVFRAVADGVQCVLVGKSLPVPMFHGYYRGQAGDMLILQDCGLPVTHVSPAVWQQIRAAILQLHEAGLHHHNLSLNNICMDSRGQIYILD